MKKEYRLFPFCLAFALVLSACTPKATTQSDAPSAEPTPSPAPTATVTPTEIPEVFQSPAFTVDPSASVALLTSWNGSYLNSLAWSGIQSYCQANGKECASIAVTANPVSSYPAGDTLREALKAGYKVIVASGADFAAGIESGSDIHPDTAFLLMGSSLNKAGNNVVSLTFDELQLGYLAGYAAVSDGYVKLGYLGSADTADYIRYGYGFVQGANDAAQTAGVTVDLLYYYVGENDTPEDIRAVADLWYRSGIRLIFDPGPIVQSTTIPSAEENGGKLITTQGPLTSQSATVAAVAYADPAQAISRTLAAAFGGRFPGGENQTLGCAEQAIDLDISRMARFGQYDYEHVYGKLAAGTVVPLTDADAQSPDRLGCDHVNVSLIEG